MSRTDADPDQNRLSLLVMRSFIFLLSLAVFGVWVIFGLNLEATRAWLSVEVALGVTGGAIVLWFLAALATRASEARRSGLRPRDPGRD